MSILVICNNKDPEPWCVSLQKKLPDVSISIFPEIKNKDSVEFAICWKPENNVLRKFPNIFKNYVNINENELQKNINSDKQSIKEIFKI